MTDDLKDALERPRTVTLTREQLERALAQMDAGALSHPNPPSADA